MAKLNSPGVQTNEIDLSGPLQQQPVGVPAGIIGTSIKGPAFVPITVGIDSDFYAKFGPTDGKKFGPLAMVEWLRNARAATYVRVLGVGNGETRNSDGSVTSAGFVVGANQPDPNTGNLLPNPYANVNGQPGQTFFLGCYMSESAGSTFFSDSGVQISTTSIPIIRGIVFAASGVLPRVSSSLAGNSAAPASTLVAANATANGLITGSLSFQNGSNLFVMLLNGHQGTDPAFPNVITASFDTTAPNYFGNVLNKDPSKLQQAGHYLYAGWDIDPVVATVTGSGLLGLAWGAGGVSGSNAESIVFLTTGSAGRNVGTSTVPNYDSFTDRFSTPRTSWIISQQFGGLFQNLFRLVALDDGAYSSAQIKIMIENLRPSTDPTNLYGTFDVVVRQFSDRDNNQQVLEQFRGLTLNPSDKAYISKAIGDIHAYFDFDQPDASQKLVINGNYPNLSNYIRVEVDSAVDNQQTDPSALPFGFRGMGHLVTSGSAPLTTVGSGKEVAAGITNILKSAIQPPVPMRQSIQLGSGQKAQASANLAWGVLFEKVTEITDNSIGNSGVTPNQSLTAFATFFPEFQTLYPNFMVRDNQGAVDTAANGIIDADRFNNNIFSLSNVQVVTNSIGTADPLQWVSARYMRKGNIVANDTNKTRGLNVNDLGLASNRKFVKFSMMMQGGFDGVNIFDTNSATLTDVAIAEEMTYSARGLQNGPTVKSYTKALDLMTNTSFVDVKLLAIPGIRQPVVTDYAIQATENQFDALYIMDLPEYDTLDNLVTSSIQQPSVANTVAAALDRSLNSSFAAAYYPDVSMQDQITKTILFVPPSVVVLGALAQNDAIGFPWFAPAGFARGTLPTAIDARVKLSRDNMDSLYDADINPIVSFPGDGTLQGGSLQGGYVVWGQKTLQQAATALDRVNVRRLLIEIRRAVRVVANTFIFEPNRDTTLSRFSSQVEPILAKIKTQAGVDRYRVIIDSSTTTQADIENGIIQGKIYVQPTKSVEFVSIDFNITNQLGGNP